MMNVSTLLRDFAAHGVEFNADGLSLRTPKWPEQCPKDLRESFADNRRAIMSRIASPIFLHVGTVPQSKCRKDSEQPPVNELIENVMCLVLIDDEVIVWLPGQSDDRTEQIARRIVQPQAGTHLKSAQLATGRKLPTILRRAVKSGRAFCTWNSRTSGASLWRNLNLPAPRRWIDLRDLVRAGGWPQSFDNLVWNLLHVHPRKQTPLGNSSSPNDNQSLMEITDHWAERIQAGLDQLLSLADLHDRLRQYDEPDLLELHNEINSRGIGLNVKAARVVLSVCREYAERKFAHIAEATGGTLTAANLSDNNFVMSWLRSWGLEFPDLNVETIERLLNQMLASGLQPHPSVEAVLQARISLAHQPFGTLVRALEMVDDSGRVRNHMNYFTNRSGEFSNAGIAIRDLLFATHWKYRWKWGISTKSPPDEDWRNLTMDEWSSDELGELVSNCFVPSEGHVFAIFDWSGLEIEVLRWLINNRLKLLDDPEEPWIDLPPPWVDQARRELAQQFRNDMSRGNEAEAGKCRLTVTPDEVQVRLPSGRVIHYRKVTSFTEDCSLSVDEQNAHWLRDRCSQGEWPDVDAMVFDIVRGVSRDFLTWALIRCAAAGGQIVAHGSDFIVLEIAEASQGKTANSLVAPLLHAPVWANGLLYEIGCMTCTTLGGGWIKTGKHTDDESLL